MRSAGSSYRCLYKDRGAYLHVYWTELCWMCCWGFHCFSETAFGQTCWHWCHLTMPMSNGVNAERLGDRRLFCNPCISLLWHSALGIPSPLARSRGIEGPCFNHCSLEALSGGSIPGMWVYMCTCIRIPDPFQTRSSSVMLCQASAAHICSQVLPLMCH